MNELEKLRQKKAHIRAGGGQKGIDNQHSKGKLTARERINLLFDEGTFVELDTSNQALLRHGQDQAQRRCCYQLQQGGHMVYAFAQFRPRRFARKYHAEKIVKVGHGSAQRLPGCRAARLEQDTGDAPFRLRQDFYQHDFFRCHSPVSAIMDPVRAAPFIRRRFRLYIHGGWTSYMYSNRSRRARPSRRTVCTTIGGRYIIVSALRI